MTFDQLIQNMKEHFATPWQRDAPVCFPLTRTEFEILLEGIERLENKPLEQDGE